MPQLDQAPRILLPLLLATLVALGPVACRKESSPVVVTPESSASTEPTSADTGPVDLSSVRLALSPVATGFDQPLFITGAGDASGRLFVCEKGGLLKVMSADGSGAQTFLDLSAKVSTQSERGLLGLAFSPQYKTTGRFYVNYTDTSGTTVISRFKVSSDPGRADPASEEELLRIEQPYANHNGGCIQFGPDKMLWIGMGDGGSGADPHRNGQNRDVLLGKMLRIDVGESGKPAAGEPYGIPADNPFANPTDEATAGEPEIWAVGMRNPWRFSFDSKTGDLWIGDVGQGDWEEIDFVAAGPSGVPVGGMNFGWNEFEGSHPFPPGAPAPADASRFTPPVIEYDHGAGNSVTGGVVVRDPAYPGLDGIYLYADFGSGRVWGAAPQSRQVGDAIGGLQNLELLATQHQVVSFGTGDAGEVYLVDFAGSVQRVGSQ